MTGVLAITITNLGFFYIFVIDKLELRADLKLVLLNFACFFRVFEFSEK